jgi:hypothetical protein
MLPAMERADMLTGNRQERCGLVMRLALTLVMLFGAAASASPRISLVGHHPSWANAANDRGIVPSQTHGHFTIRLARAPERQAAFDALLAAQYGRRVSRRWGRLDVIAPTDDVARLAAWVRGARVTSASACTSVGRRRAGVRDRGDRELHGRIERAGQWSQQGFRFRDHHGDIAVGNCSDGFAFVRVGLTISAAMHANAAFVGSNALFAHDVVVRWPVEHGVFWLGAPLLELVPQIDNAAANAATNDVVEILERDLATRLQLRGRPRRQMRLVPH